MSGNQEKLNRILNGECLVVSDKWLDEVAASNPEESALLVTALNRGQCGVLDRYVCWSCRRQPPASLEYKQGRDGFQIAVANEEKVG